MQCGLQNSKRAHSKYPYSNSPSRPPRFCILSQKLGKVWSVFAVPVSIGHTGMRSGSAYGKMQVSWKCGLLISKEIWTEGIGKGKVLSVPN